MRAYPPAADSPIYDILDHPVSKKEQRGEYFVVIQDMEGQTRKGLHLKAGLHLHYEDGDAESSFTCCSLLRWHNSQVQAKLKPRIRSSTQVSPVGCRGPDTLAGSRLTSGTCV